MNSSHVFANINLKVVGCRQFPLSSALKAMLPCSMETIVDKKNFLGIHSQKSFSLPISSQNLFGVCFSSSVLGSSDVGQSLCIVSPVPVALCNVQYYVLSM